MGLAMVVWTDTAALRLLRCTFGGWQWEREETEEAGKRKKSVVEGTSI